MAPSPSAAAAEPAGWRAQRAALAVGLAIGAAGASWILATHERRPVFALCYHVPLAVVFGCWGTQLLLSWRRAPTARLAAATLAGLGLVAARVAWNWPLSGHGVLAGLIAAATRWRWLRCLAAAVLVQAFVTKVFEGTVALSVVWGAAAGAALAALARGCASSAGTDLS